MAANNEVNGKDSEPKSCRRCRTAPSQIVIRAEPLCRDCFVKYVNTKVVKRMESFRVRNVAEGRARRLLLPVSCGPCSLSLLQTLSTHLQSQRNRTRRTGYELHVLHIDMSATERDPPSKDQLNQLSQRFSEDASFATVPLEDVFVKGTTADLLASLSVQGTPHEGSPHEKLQAVLRSLPSTTARSDVINMLKTRLIVAIGKELDCECVVWGDSTTRLAEKTLAETAKGRGFSLASQVGDGDSTLGLSFQYPLKDVLKKELVAYVDMVDPPLSSLVAGDPSNEQVATITKNTTIDSLMKQYFESVEENYPSIVANVVRTTGRLEAPQSVNEADKCELCQYPVTDGRFGIHGWGGDQNDVAGSSADASMKLCYGCSRNVPV